MFQEMLNKLATGRGSMPMKKPMKKMNLGSAFRSLAVKRKVKGKSFKPKTPANPTVDNVSNSY